MNIDFGSNILSETIIIPVFEDRLDALPDVLQSFRALKLVSSIGTRHAVNWFYGRNDEHDFLIVGLGKTDGFNEAIIREAAGNAGRSIWQERRQSAVVSFEALIRGDLVKQLDTDLISGWVEGWKLGTYSFTKYKSKPGEKMATHLYLNVHETEDNHQAIQLGNIRAESVIWARELTNEPPNGLRPRMLAERVAERFAETQVQIKLYEGAGLDEQQFAGLTAVGRGSSHSPVFIELRYCTDASLPLTALIGKGITFDTGGISLKRDYDLSEMRMDMAGAAAVLGALDIIVNSGTAANVAVLIPVAENCPFYDALLPGETIRYANGLTVQVCNTDAEGRLILADALIHAHTIGASEAINVATLTNSVAHAFGSKIVAAFGDDAITAALKASGAPFGEKLWQMPLELEYESYLDSDYADISHISNVPGARVITPALFLHKFVDASLKWVHIDMNGAKSASSAKGEHAVGATGFGVRMLAAYLMDRAVLRMEETNK
ncbi:leucyl aminopeptidase [Paenibacillus endophyticus]|uniref:Probable cytosol aminopeptidase n=1 Tax=Paenibacillus endophyticus TaxID=1294268 RepID=A0A7W5CDW5_9BACL|nr:leucyl aminopeptidase family protein [Paenibacillus endophyticus]MBB3155901.1 leucyl aminopeptidase [Paenibacillus endophyticus]